MSSLATGNAQKPGKSSQPSTETQQEQEPDSIILEEEIDPNYEPTDDEVIEYAKWLGFDLPGDDDLLYIAREGLKAPLPNEWKPCKTTDTDEIYYFNFETGESTWDHPCDEYYKKLYEQAKSKKLAKQQDKFDPKKRKEKQDVKKLLKSNSSTTPSSNTRDEPSGTRLDQSTADLTQPPKLASPMQRNTNDLRSPNTTPSTSAGDRGGFKPTASGSSSQQSPLDRKPLPGISKNSPSVSTQQGRKDPEGGENEVSFGAEAHDPAKSASKPPLPGRRSQSRSGRQERTGSDSDESSGSTDNKRRNEEASRLQRKLEKLQEEYDALVKENESLQEQMEKSQSDFRTQKQNLIKEHEREVSQMEVDNARELRQLRDSNRESLKKLEEEYEERIRNIEAKYEKKISETRDNTRASVAQETEERVRQEMNRELESIKRSKESLEQRIQRLEEEKEDLQQKTYSSDQGDSQVRELQNLKEDAVRAKEQAQQDFIDQKKRLIDDYEKKISDMKQQLQDATSEKEKAETQLSEAKDSLNRKDEQVEKLTAAKEELEKQLEGEKSSHERRVQELRQSHGDEHTRVEEYKEEAAQLRSTISEQRNQLENKDKEIQKLKEQHARLECNQKETQSEDPSRDVELSHEVSEFRRKLEKEKEVLQQELDGAYAEHFRKLRALKASESDLKQPRSSSSPQPGFLPSQAEGDTRQTRSLTSLYHAQQQSSPGERVSTETINSSMEKLRDCLRQELSSHFELVKQTIQRNFDYDFSRNNSGSGLSSEVENMLLQVKNTLDKETQSGITRIENRLQETTEKMARLEDYALSGQGEQADSDSQNSQKQRLETLASSLENVLKRQEEVVSSMSTPKQDSTLQHLLEHTLDELRNGTMIQSTDKMLSSIQHIQRRVDELGNQLGRANDGVEMEGNRMEDVLERYKELIAEHRSIIDSNSHGATSNEEAAKAATHETKQTEIRQEGAGVSDNDAPPQFSNIGHAVAEALFLGWTSRYQLDESVVSTLDSSLASFKKDLNNQRHELIRDRELWKADARRILKLKNRSYRIVSSSNSPSSSGTLSSVGAAPSPPKTPAYRYLRPQRSQKSQKPALMDAKKVLDKQADSLNRKVHKYREARTVINEFRQILHEVYQFLSFTKQNATNNCNDAFIRELVGTLNSVDARFTEKVRALYDASMERGLPLQWPSAYFRISNNWGFLQAYQSQEPSKENRLSEDTLSFHLSGSEFSSLSGYIDRNNSRNSRGRKEHEGSKTNKERERRHRDVAYPVSSHRPGPSASSVIPAHPPVVPFYYDSNHHSVQAPAPQRNTTWSKLNEPYWAQYHDAYKHWSSTADDHAKWLRQLRENVEKSKTEMHRQREPQSTRNQERITGECTPPPTSSQADVSIDFVSPVTSLPEEVSHSSTDHAIASATSGSPDTSVSTEVSA